MGFPEVGRRNTEASCEKRFDNSSVCDCDDGFPLVFGNYSVKTFF